MRLLIGEYADRASIEREFVLTNSAGLHARPAAQFVQMAGRFPDVDVWIRKGSRAVSGRSLLAVLSLGAGPGTPITIRCEGPQAQEAMAALAALIETGFGE